MGTEQFLNTLFHSKPEDAHILIWKKHLPDQSGQELKVSAWFKDVKEAVNYCNVNGQPVDLYVGCGVAPKAFGPNRRCQASEISGVPAVWLDIDILDPAHKKPNLPETEVEAKKIIDAFPLKPTMIVHSGHGFQCWWVFNTFIGFTKPEYRVEISEFVHKFVWTMRDVARSMNYDMDMTFDLARVMRVPGSKNWKNAVNPAPVTLVENSGVLYDPRVFRDTLNKFILDLGDKATPITPLSKKAKSNSLIAGTTFVLDPEAEPPKAKFEALLEVDAKFKASWERKRKDFQDQSPSSYDMSLASFGFVNEWEPQEIVNLLIAWRRKYGEDLKLREDYYIRTLTVASNVLEKRNIARDLDSLAADAQINGGYNPEMLLKAKDLLSNLLKVKVINLYRYLLTPYEYKLETAKGDIHLGTVNNLIEQVYFKRKIADVIGLYLPRMKEEHWKSVAQALLDSCITIELSEDTSNHGILKSWIIKYLQYRQVLYDRNDAIINHTPFFEDKYIYIFLDAFQEFVLINCKERKSPKELGLMLKEFGWKSKNENFKPADAIKYQSAWVWFFPLDQDKDISFFADPILLEEQRRLYLERKALQKSKMSNPDDY